MDNNAVAPHAGAWIETIATANSSTTGVVAPHAGAWIETAKDIGRNYLPGSRSPRGSVD